MTEHSFVSADELGEGDEFNLGGQIYTITSVQKNELDNAVIIEAFQILNYNRTCTITVQKETIFTVYL